MRGWLGALLVAILTWALIALAVVLLLKAWAA